MKKKLIIATVATVLVLAASGLSAQVEPAPYIQVHYDRIDPAHTAAWEENGKAWVEAFAGVKAGEDFYWRGYQSGFTYAWVSDMPNYAYMDASEARQEMLNEKLGEEKFQELMAGADGAIIEHYNEIWKYEPDMSYQSEGFSPEGMTAINVSVVDVKPSMTEEYRELVKEAIAAVKKVEAPINFFAYSVPFGKGSFAFVTWGKDRGDLHSGPEFAEYLTKAVGEEKTKEMIGRYLNCVAAEEESDWRSLPDLSYMGVMMEEEAKEM